MLQHLFALTEVPSVLNAVHIPCSWFVLPVYLQDALVVGCRAKLRQYLTGQCDKSLGGTIERNPVMCNHEYIHVSMVDVHVSPLPVPIARPAPASAHRPLRAPRERHSHKPLDFFNRPHAFRQLARRLIVRV